MRYSLFFIFGLFAINSEIASAQEVSVNTPIEEIRGSLGIQIDQEMKSLVTYYDSIKNNVNAKVEITPEDLGVIRRMRNTASTVPLDYNADVKAYVEKYTSQNWRPYMNRLLGLSRHYFSIYDKVFDEVNIPAEIKYLSLVESSLNPHLISTSGAVGPWQFMYGTAKEYNLTMNTTIDERKDAYASCYAFAQYMKTSYDQFNDWLVALASYNCGRGCVQRAIARSGLHNPNFWELAPYLPRETRNYIPKFIAMTYVMANADHYDIEAVKTELDLDVKTMMVNQTVNLKNVATALGLSLVDLKYYNPAFKKDLVTATAEKPLRLLLPQTKTINDSLLYLSLNTNLPVVTNAKEEEMPVVADGYEKKYRVKAGESLASISRKFDVSVQDLRSWNNLSRNSAVVGRSLIVEKPINSKYTQNVQVASSKKKSDSVTYYTVKKGDSLERIAKKHDGVSVSKLKADNNIKSSVIKPGMRLKIKRG